VSGARSKKYPVGARVFFQAKTVKPIPTTSACWDKIEQKGWPALISDSKKINREWK
jgi:hypothetical protein